MKKGQPKQGTFVPRWGKYVGRWAFCLFVCCSTLCVSMAQTVSLNSREETLVKVIEELRKQTLYNFLFNSEDLAHAKAVTVELKDVSLEQALDAVLAGKGLAYRIGNATVIIRKFQTSQTPEARTVKGKVVDEQGNPLPGVTVMIKGTGMGVVTNSEGNYSLQLLSTMKSVSLLFTFIGMKPQEVAYVGQKEINVTLHEENTEMDEVVVRAYGTQKKREMISAISSVNAEEMKELPSASIAGMLQGRLAGVNIIQQSGAPGSASVIAVRGFNSLLVDGASDGQPLWVIDGVPMHSFVSPVTGTNTLADLDPSMIESVQVLKDAAAASIYGSRAGNGVILVTTKKGKVGSTQFSANASYSVSQLMEYPTQTGGRMERELDLLYYRNYKQTYSEKGASYYPDSYEQVYGTTGVYDLFWGNGTAGKSKLDHTLQDSLDPYYNNSTNWWKYAFRTGKVLNANIQASGGNDRFRYMMGLGYYDEEGIMINSGYTRANMISNLSANFTSKLRLDTRIYLTYVNRTLNKSGSTSRYEGLSVDPIAQRTILPATDRLEEEWLAKVNGIKDRTDDYRAMVSAYLEYQIIKGLTLSASGSIDFSQGNMNKFTPSTMDASYHENKSEGAVDRTIMLSTEELLRYSNSIGEVHNFDIVLGYNVNKEQNFYIGGWGSNGASDDIYYYDPSKSKDVVNHGSVSYPRYVSTRYYKSDFTEKVMVSYFGRFGYNYKQRYLLEFTFRRDGSSTFGEGHRWANFPSVALGWTFSEEPFIKCWTSSWLNWGKIRGSFGTSGQVLTEAYLAHGLMTIDTRTFLGNSGMSSGTPISPDLTWEKTKQYDFGIDMDMFNYRLNLKLDYYYKYTSSLIYKVMLPGNLYPFASRVENAMEVSNEGLELELQADIFRESTLSWRMKLNMARNWNRFEKSYTGKDLDNLVIGRPLHGLYVYAQDGFYDSEEEVPRYYTVNGEVKYFGGVAVKNGVSGRVGNYNLRDFDGDGFADLYYAGSTLPLVHGGWVNELRWKDFDFNMLVNYSLGRKVINRKIENSFKLLGPSAKMLDYRELRPWSEQEENANIPAWGNKIYSSLDSNIEKVNYLTLKQLTLGYNLPNRIAGKMGFSGVRFFGTVENLFYLSNYSGENPEIINIYSGSDSGTEYPLPRKWTLGLTLNF